MIRIPQLLQLIFLTGHVSLRIEIQEATVDGGLSEATTYVNNMITTYYAFQYFM